MLLTITTTHQPTADLGYLLHKHPDRFQSFELSFGKAHVFYPEVSEDRATVSLLLDVDPVGMVRGKNRDQSFSLGNYVNDRPYVGSSFMSVAISQVFSSAMSGRCKDRPELAATPIPLTARIEVLPVRGGEGFLHRMFEPLGYTVEATRFSNPGHNHFKGIVGDDRPFDPTLWLTYKKVCLFGFQFFASKLPVGTVLVWNKKRPSQLGKFLSDAELAWMKGGKGCYVFNHHWNGFDRESERGQKTLHPTQKPVALFRWILERMKIKPGQWVLDPYCGSGPCGVACMELGINYIGIEIEPEYAAIAVRRVTEAARATEPSN